MRDIKFRAWDRKDKCWIYAILDKRCGFIVDLHIPADLEDWLQYTGLKDKNGKVIYEGDIALFLDEESFYAEVVWYRNGWAFKYDIGWSQTDGQTFEYLSELEFEEGASVCEVMGNIYENNNLLPKEK